MKTQGNPVLVIVRDSGVADVKTGTVPAGDARVDVLCDYVWTGGEVEKVPFPLQERSLIHCDSMASVFLNGIVAD